MRSQRGWQAALAWASCAIGLLVLFMVAGTAAVAAQHVVPERVAQSARWKASQFVQADAAGRVFLLRTDTFEVYPLTPKGALDEASRLERLSGDEDPFIRDAALSPDGRDWLLLDVVQGPRLFHNGKEQPLTELGWRAAAVALPAGRPLIAVSPVPAHEVHLRVRSDGKVMLDSKESPPALVSLTGSDWKAVVREDYEFGSSDWREANGRMRLLRAVRLTAEPKGGVWVADEFGYRLRKFSPSGQLRSTLTVGIGKPVVAQRPPADLEKRVAQSREVTGQRVDPASLRFTAPHVVNGLAATKDGRLYVVVEAAGQGRKAQLAVDRFDPSGRKLERLFLDGLDSIAGRLSVAAGRDALYIAAFSGDSGGVWRLPWDLLDGASWEKVADAKIDGQVLAD